MKTHEELSSYLILDLLIAFVTGALDFLWAPLIYPLRLARFAIMWGYGLHLAMNSKGNEWSWAVTLLGGTMNAAAIIANKGKMPVFSNRKITFDPGIHKEGNKSSKLRYLTDIYSSEFGVIFSLGDVVISLGLLMLGLKVVVEFFESAIKPVQSTLSDFKKVVR